MERLPVGELIDGTYRVESLLSSSERAHVYAVKHTRFVDMPLVLKIVPHDRTADFERDSQALASLTSPAFAAVVDRGVLGDGRAYRVMRRFEGPSLEEAMKTTTIDDGRANELMVGLAGAVFEAQQNGVGPLDLSVGNLMFERGTGSHLGLVRALKPGANGADPDADQAALTALRTVLEQGRVTALSTRWSPPAPPSSKPGTRIGGWRVVRPISEKLTATVYDVIGENGEVGVLKIAGPIADCDRFERELQLLTTVKSAHLVKVISFGTHDSAPYYVMELLEGHPLDVLLRSNGPLDLAVALEIVVQMLVGSEQIAAASGGPTDFSLDHCFVTEKPWRIKLTHPMSAGEGRFKLYAGGRVERAAMDPWSAAIALYELLTGRLPFPITRQSLAKAWMGMPVPMQLRNNKIPGGLSMLVSALVSGEMTMSRVALIDELKRFRLPDAPPKPNEPSIVIQPVAPIIIHPAPVPVPVPPAKHVPTKVSQQTPGDVKPEPKREAVVGFSHAPQPPAVGKPMRENLPPPPPIDWRIEVHSNRAPIASLTAAAFRDDEVVIANAEAVGRLRSGRWSIDRVRDQPGGIRTLVPVGERDYLAISSDRRLLRLNESNTFEPWGPPLARFAFYGLVPFADGRDGAYIVGGSTDRGRGMIARLEGERITIVAEELETNTLHSAAVMADGTLVAVGARGTVARFRGGALIEMSTPCDSDLHVVGVTKGDIVVAGAGAWAFRVTTAPLSTEIEPVDTTSNLACMAVDDSGNAWLGGDRGRILRRREKHWRRMNKPFPGDPAVVAIQAKPGQIRAVLADGSIAIGAPVAKG